MPVVTLAVSKYPFPLATQFKVQVMKMTGTSLLHLKYGKLYLLLKIKMICLQHESSIYYPHEIIHNI